MESLAVNQAFWRDKKVLVTGHTGFKGSWLSLWLSRMGARVVGYALDPPTEPSLFALARVADSMRSIRGDVRDLEALRALVREEEPAILFHLAAQSLVRASYENPVETYSTNVIGTVNVLEAMRDSTVRAAVIVTSDKCYENKEWVWGYREADPLGGADPYSSSKACAELVSAAYRRSFFNQPDAPRIATARAGNVFGGGDWSSDRLIPDVMRAFMAGRKVSIRNPHAVRPWQHVIESLHGYLALAEHLLTNGREFADAWNFGPWDQDVRPVQWVVDRLAARWGDHAAWQIDERQQPHEATLLKLDSSKARQRLGITPRLNIDTALDWTVEWYRAYVDDGASSRRVVEEQIERYEALS
jgi:CDP-glucose 4,6-dehydratase